MRHLRLLKNERPPTPRSVVQHSEKSALERIDDAIDFLEDAHPMAGRSPLIASALQFLEAARTDIQFKQSNEVEDEGPEGSFLKLAEILIERDVLRLR